MAYDDYFVCFIVGQITILFHLSIAITTHTTINFVSVHFTQEMVNVPTVTMM